MSWKEGNPGCPCCTCLWTFTVRDGCASAIVVGAVVSVKQGGVEIANGTTASGTGQCVLDVPAGSYDVTVTPPAGSGLDPYSATISHTCAQTTNVTLPVDSEHSCQSGCPCKVMPDEIALTFDVDPTQLPRCVNPDDCTVVYDPVENAWIVDPFWVRASDGHVWRGVFRCNPVGVYSIVGEPHDPSDSPFVFGQTIPASVITCNPFSVTNGRLNQLNCGTWSAVGL